MEEAERMYIALRRYTNTHYRWDDKTARAMVVGGRLTPEAKDSPKFRGWIDGILSDKPMQDCGGPLDMIEYNTFLWFGRDQLRARITSSSAFR